MSVPLDCEVHVVPPSIVLRIVPTSPTAHPILASMNLTDAKYYLVVMDFAITTAQNIFALQAKRKTKFVERISRIFAGFRDCLDRS